MSETSIYFSNSFITATSRS